MTLEDIIIDMKKINFLVIVLAFFSAVTMAYAAENVGTSSVRPNSRNKGIQELRNNVKSIEGNYAATKKMDRSALGDEISVIKKQEDYDLQIIRQQLESEIQAIRNNTGLSPEERDKEIAQKREAARQLLQNKIKEYEAQLLQKREEFESELKAKNEETRTKIEEQKVEFQKKLAIIKDGKKKETVQNINDRLQKLNQDQINSLVKVMDNIEQVLKNITSRTDKAELAGKDVTVVKADIKIATDNISAFRDALKTQASKTYTINITTEKTLKANIKKTREMLFNDLKTLRDKAKTTREAVIKTANDLSKIQGIDNLENENSEPVKSNQ